MTDTPEKCNCPSCIGAELAPTLAQRLGDALDRIEMEFGNAVATDIALIAIVAQRALGVRSTASNQERFNVLLAALHAEMTAQIKGEGAIGPKVAN
ncbi:hypothetical protein [Sulfitobacter sp. 1A15106]|uniref:hypothetical protein n=1 Tax=Sulfitobacter sp. 1A15106 TaxID=3368590 RepID=UPI003744F26F